MAGKHTALNQTALDVVYMFGSGNADFVGNLLCRPCGPMGSLCCYNQDLVWCRTVPRSKKTEKQGTVCSPVVLTGMEL